ncbi:TFIIH subunit Tfb4/p34 [Emericellopsis atlantica]|uniref:General transcription and DNA repair factor IIH subunit TFB4 n=1 Tax=Emericellopsis atlantica TaxID=2614577 RepID=A0A9P8CSV5_9HYPO|nr:TFIIH subunit Tfb4/p34 [Emericellopsis atlantica]KAG9257580.1 TFIIH subunit Tfb4/p34 [Emericellopsis atlantica]
MDAVDKSDHYEVGTYEETPSLLSIIIDTNPRAWAAIGDTLPLSRAIANILVFVNAHLAFSNANQVSLIAAHVNRAAWLYPSASTPNKPAQPKDDGGDVEMQDAAAPPPGSANKYPQFAQIETAVLASIRNLVDSTTKQDLDSTTTQLSGALTLALCHINKATSSMSASAVNATSESKTSDTVHMGLKGRILVISVSDSEPSQYIPTMNAVFAAAHGQVAIDTLSLSGDATFLQQACYNTGGTFLAAPSPQAILSYLMFGLIADTEARKSLVAPAHDTVDFRAACFCHGKVVDLGFVCSICLSIFCEPPENAECLTCGTKLALGNYGSKPQVVPRKKKKKKRPLNGTPAEGTASGTATPAL